MIDVRYSYFILLASFLMFAPSLRAAEEPMEKSILGKYIGFEGKDHIGIEIGPGSNGEFSVTIFEEGLPFWGHRAKEDDRYEGKGKFLQDGLFEIELLKKFDGEESRHLARKLRKMTATVKKSGEELLLSIPKNGEWEPVEVVKIAKNFTAKPDDYPAESLKLETDLYGIYRGTEGKNAISVEIDDPKHGVFPISFFEKDRHETTPILRREKEEKDVRYEGTAVYNGGKLHIALRKKYDEITANHLERNLHVLVANISHENGNVKLSIPKNHVWEEVIVTKTK